MHFVFVLVDLRLHILDRSDRPSPMASHPIRLLFPTTHPSKRFEDEECEKKHRHAGKVGEDAVEDRNLLFVRHEHAPFVQTNADSKNQVRQGEDRKCLADHPGQLKGRGNDAEDAIAQDGRQVVSNDLRVRVRHSGLCRHSMDFCVMVTTTKTRPVFSFEREHKQSGSRCWAQVRSYRGRSYQVLTLVSSFTSKSAFEGAVGPSCGIFVAMSFRTATTRFLSWRRRLLVLSR